MPGLLLHRVKQGVPNAAAPRPSHGHGFRALTASRKPVLLAGARAREAA
jgi:hypothetical protein